MNAETTRTPSGHVFRVDRARGPVWYAKYRLPDGRQVQKKLGPAWTERGRPQDGYLTKRLAERELRRILTEAESAPVDTATSVLPASAPAVSATFAEAVDEWLRYVKHERATKSSTLHDYRMIGRRLKRELGDLPLEQVTPQVLERWKAGLGALSNRTIQKYLIAVHGILKRAMKVYGLPSNAAADVERPRLRKSNDIDVLSGEEVRALVRAAASERDAALYLTAAFTGLRLGELLALRWRDVDFAHQSIHVRRSFTRGSEDTPKSGLGRVVPMVDDVAETLARLGQRERFTADGDLVFAGDLGGHLDGKKVRRDFKATLARAGLRELRFHDLRHTFGTLAIQKASILQVQNWLGHADIKTTMVYLRFRSQATDAALLAEAFADGATAEAADVSAS